MFFIIFHGEKKNLLQENEYNWAISYQIKKGICFNVYKSAYSDNTAKASYLFNVRLTITHFVFYAFGLPSSEESEENLPSRINTQLIHEIYDAEITECG